MLVDTTTVGVRNTIRDFRDVFLLPSNSGVDFGGQGRISHATAPAWCATRACALRPTPSTRRRRDLIDDDLIGVPATIVADRTVRTVKYLEEPLGRKVRLSSAS